MDKKFWYFITIKDTYVFSMMSTLYITFEIIDYLFKLNEKVTKA